MSDRRQALLGAAALGLAAVAGLGAWRERQSLPETRPIPSAPGFRRLSAGGIAAATEALTVGIDPPDGPDRAAMLAPEALCAALFRAGGAGTPVALFTDYRCPTCPALSSRLAGLGGPALTITRHEWPILGAPSRFAARLALAAGRQGHHAEMHAHLMRRGVRPSEAGVRQAADALGLDAARLLAEMATPGVAARLDESARLARQFGFRGTPALVIGDTALEGLPAAALLRRLARERRAPCPA